MHAWNEMLVLTPCDTFHFSYIPLDSLPVQVKYIPCEPRHRLCGSLVGGLLPLSSRKFREVQVGRRGGLKKPSPSESDWNWTPEASGAGASTGGCAAPRGHLLRTGEPSSLGAGEPSGPTHLSTSSVAPCRAAPHCHPLSHPPRN